MGGWIHGNIDEVDEHVSLKKLNALQTVVENQLLEVKKKQEEDPNKKQKVTATKIIRHTKSKANKQQHFAHV